MCSQPEVSLDSVTTTGPGATVDLGRNYAHHTVVFWTTGNPTSLQVYLEISHDGQKWFPVNSGGGTPVGSTHADRVARYVRANLGSLTGGTSPTVTATVASA